jgi:prolyl oligopeptidase
MDVKTREKMRDHIQWVKFSSTSWYKDGFFYSRYDEPSKDANKLKVKIQDQKIFYNKVGTSQSEDRLIFQDSRNPQRIYVGSVTDDEKYLLITASEGAAGHNLFYYKNLEKDSPVTPVIDKPIGHFDIVDETGW